MSMMSPNNSFASSDSLLRQNSSNPIYGNANPDPSQCGIVHCIRIIQDYRNAVFSMKQNHYLVWLGLVPRWKNHTK